MELRRKVKAAMTYPVIVVIAAVTIVCFLCTFIVPKFIDLFHDLGVKELPWMTQVLVDINPEASLAVIRAWLRRGA